MTHSKRNPGAGTAGASEIAGYRHIDAFESTPAIVFEQAARCIARRARLSIPHARVIASLRMGARR